MKSRNLSMSGIVVGSTLLLFSGGALLWARKIMLNGDFRHAYLIIFATFLVNISAFFYVLATIRWRVHKGRCIRCGYDPHGVAGRCPTCGGLIVRVRS